MDSSEVHVLIVEDDPDAALLIKNLLGSSLGKVRVTAAANLHEAVTALTSLGAAIDVVVLDLGLPDLPGTDPLVAVDAVLAAPLPPPVVVVTGQPDSLGAAAVSRGAQDFVTKDTLNDRHVLARAVSFAMLRHRRGKDLARQRLQLLRANAQLQHFAGSVAHDLKSPIATAVMTMETIRSPALQGHPETRDQMLERCEGLLRRAAKQVDLILDDIATAQQGEFVIVDVAAVVAAAVLDIADAGRLSLEVEADTPLSARPAAVHQIVINLLRNALQHNPDATVRVRISTSRADPFSQLIVEDDGIGIPVDRRTEMFRSGATGPYSDGTGLGLTTVALTAQSLGGTVVLGESEELGGLAVTVMLASPVAVPLLDP